MLWYLIKTLILTVFSFVIIYFYYFTNSSHIENFDWYLSYIIIIWIIYAIYKYFQFEFSEKKASFSFAKISWFFLVNLLTLSVLFFWYNDLSVWNWLILFSKIIFYSILPILILLISYWFWKKITWYLDFVKEENYIYNFLISISLGFLSFIFILDIFWVLGFYNLFIVFWILIWFIIFSCKEIIAWIKTLFWFKIEFDIEEWSYLKLISTEFLFIVSSIVLAVNLISIVRPFPIGWDDLWVYMNYPHLMAEAWNLLSLWAMYAWQTFTWIWYMFWNPTQAFFLNNIWWFLSFIALILISSDLLKSNKKTFINIPMLVWTMFVVMPMVVFQQAKDMKLDPALFFFSIVSVYLLIKYYLKIDNISYLEKIKNFAKDKILHKNFNKSNLLLIFIIWLLAWFAFSIKFTSLLLISALIWLIFYSRLGLIWFAWYLAIYFAIFTKANLWSMMNVVVNPNNIVWFETNFFLISWIIWLWLFAYSLFKNKWIIKKFFLELFVFLAWVFLVLTPWLWKNISESFPNITISSILNWKSDSYSLDRTKLYTQEELDIIEENKVWKVTSEWTTTNEDFWRYFGYEKWVNNYIKLPWNLTMQVNQAWEYTDIWYLLLALLPVILLFLVYRKEYFSYLIIVVLFIELLVFIKPDSALIQKEKLSSISETNISLIFEKNNNVFKDLKFNNDIYDIEFSDYISDADINTLVNEENSFDSVKKKAIEMFYKELNAKVIDPSLWQKLIITSTDLSDEDYNYLSELREEYNKYFSFKSDINSFLVLEKFINDNSSLFEEWEKEKIISIWKENRNFNQTISDFFAKNNLPAWYIIVFLFFLVPTLFLLLTLKDDKKDEDNEKVKIFKKNLVFLSFYTFLWTISAFWIVWYWITMYFSFLLMIAVWAFYMLSYKETDDEKTFYAKMIWALIFALIILIYIVNSVFPHSFTNLKWASYANYKSWNIVTLTNANFIYHPEYLKILYYLNIDDSKREEFLKTYLEEDIVKAVSWIEKADIYTIKATLTEIINKKHVLAKQAETSLNNLYKNISNPSDEFKSKDIIYRIWTFLKYHISENNNRLLEDSLITNFNDYIFNINLSETIKNFKTLWIKYLLVDLNAATIDKDERHHLTSRYEKLLYTFSSQELELVETDSLCLKLALEQYSKSNKSLEDRQRFITIAWVNYESYDEDNNQISRSIKLYECYNEIYNLIVEDKIDENNYSYFNQINLYIKQNIENFQTEKQIYSLIQQQVKSWYKALFKIN